MSCTPGVSMPTPVISTCTPVLPMFTPVIYMSTIVYVVLAAMLCAIDYRISISSAVLSPVILSTAVVYIVSFQ